MVTQRAPAASAFDYDRALPLDVEESGSERRNGVSVHDISYHSPGHGRIKAYWVVPAGNGSFAGLIFVHPGPGDRATFLDEAVLLTRRGAASLVVEAPWAQAEAWGEKMGEPEHDRQEHTKTAIDLLRAVDFLNSRSEVDASRIGFVGHSFGALFGGILAGVEKRIKAFVLMAGVGSFTDVAAANIPTLKGEALEEYRRGLTSIDPIHFIGDAAPAALFFQLAREDAFPHDALLAYAEVGSEPKRIAWYDADHYSVNEIGRDDRIEWLQSKLGLND